MISHRTLVFLVIGLVLFSGSAWLGYRMHTRTAATSQLKQNGWCCISGQQSCSITPGSAECRAAGGILFNWDRATCNGICSTAKPPRIKIRGSSSSAAALGTAQSPSAQAQ